MTRTKKRLPLKRSDHDKKKAARKARYSNDPDKEKATRKARYSNDPDKEKSARKAHYSIDPGSASKAHYNFAKNRRPRMKSFKTYCAHNRQRMCANRRGRYVLTEPKPDVKDWYMKGIEDCLLGNSKARAQLMAAYKKQHKIVVKRMSRVLGRTVCKIVAKTLLNKGLHIPSNMLGLCSRGLDQSMPFRLEEVQILV